MEGFIEKVFLKYGHTKPTHSKLTLHKNREIKYVATQKLIPVEDTRPALDAVGIKTIQEIIGALIYYAQDGNNKLSVALSDTGYQK